MKYATTLGGVALYLSFMTTTLQYSHILTTDSDKALEFYQDGLGLTVLNNVEQGGLRWITLGTEGIPNTGQVVLSPVGVGQPEDQADALQKLLAEGGLPQIVFASDDLDTLYARIRSMGYEVVQELMDQGWGPKGCAFKDPSGNTVRIQQNG